MRYCQPSGRTYESFKLFIRLYTPASPYIIALGNLGIGILPHIIPFLLTTTIFSAGSACAYCSTRTPYGLALEGRAPRFLTKMTKTGTPVYCLGVALDWLISLTTAATVIDYIVICFTYICFYMAYKTQNFDRSRLTYVGRFQPISAYVGLVWMTCVVICYGYRSLNPFSATSFFIQYAMVHMASLIFCFWKYYKRTKTSQPYKVHLVWDAPWVATYEELLSEVEPLVGFLRDICNYFSLKAGGFWEEAES
ncbi:hypothetical protein CORC01_01489 [Colletotrichum orchidophilum]|uniref:Amino acid permease/ SLC12A domain-containing protein n=1 Tax=Colletotrichum orchidophilum TaxID=1209926 RepID=A0A1G4BP75_9PEZI|nr:uncharacterized protein CORC01_01489 [Colletotrichum orchidophilum]OHF03105.1 hypothetical protein CORC01_01489 [Colletotrichum orchidophilum]